MTRKRPYPKESITKPGRRKSKATITAAKVAASERETLPPPPDNEPSVPPGQQKNSGVRPRPRRSIPAATVDEVTADMSKDPRRED